MQSTEEADRQLHKLNKSLVGWTVTAVNHNYGREGGLFILSLKKDKMRRKVRLFATDLGWWLKTDKIKGGKSPQEGS